jgi:short-subunit dehydrogenase
LSGDNNLSQQANNTISTLKWALVTGASAGIGAEFCRKLAALGYSIVLVARRENRLLELARELQQEFSVSTRVYTSDLASPDAASKLAQRLQQDEIIIEFLVNNAGYGLPGHFNAPSWQHHADFIQVMMSSVCDLTYRLIPAMQEQKKGYVINVASLAGLVPGSAGHTLYGASKAFLIRFSESLAMENPNTGVAVSALCPGFTYSEFHDVTGTRDLVSKMPSWMWQTSAEVVDFGIEAVTRDKPLVIAVSGWVNRFIAHMMRWLPTGLAYWMIKRMSGNFRHTESAEDE